MKILVLSLAASLLSIPVTHAVPTDCHQTLKDMLQGTLDLEGDVNNSQSNPSPGSVSGCTLATLPDTSLDFTEGRV